MTYTNEKGESGWTDVADPFTAMDPWTKQRERNTPDTPMPHVGPRTPPGDMATSSAEPWEQQCSWETYEVASKKLKTDKDEAERIDLQDWARGSCAIPTLALGSGAARGDGDRLGYQVAPELRAAPPPHMAEPMDEHTLAFSNLHDAADMEERYGDKFSKARRDNEKPTKEKIEVHKKFAEKAKQSMADLWKARLVLPPEGLQKVIGRGVWKWASPTAREGSSHGRGERD